MTPVSITPGTLLQHAATRYLEELAVKASPEVGTRAASTYQTRARALSWLSRPLPDGQVLADTKLGDLRRSAIVQWVDDLGSLPRSKGKGEGVVRSADRLGWVGLSALLTWCADRHDDLALMPVLMRRVRWEYSALPGQALTWEQLDSIRDELAVRDRPARGCHEHSATQTAIRVLRVIADNGARGYEIRRSRVEQFCPVRGTITWQRGKNKKARVIVLSEESIAICKRQAATDAAATTGLLFPNSTTRRPYTHQALGRLLRRICEGIGLNGVKLHDFRRTLATLAHEAVDDDGRPLVSLEEIAANLGDTVDVVRDIYIATAVSPGARRVNAILNPPREKPPLLRLAATRRRAA